MWVVATNLLIGTDEDARDRERLFNSGVKHVINCAAELQCYFPDSFTYTRLDLFDPDARFHTVIDETVRTVEKHRRTGGVLVHCHGALSRSPSVILAYLCSTGLSLFQSAEALAGVLPTRPNSIFLQQLLDRFPVITQDDTMSKLYSILAAQG